MLDLSLAILPSSSSSTCASPKLVLSLHPGLKRLTRTSWNTGLIQADNLATVALVYYQRRHMPYQINMSRGRVGPATQVLDPDT